MVIRAQLTWQHCATSLPAHPQRRQIAEPALAGFGLGGWKALRMACS